jgi:hypothetical protein
MRWMMIAFLGSIAALLLAAAGVARHIWMQRSQLRGNPDSRPAAEPGNLAGFDPVEEINQEVEL